MRLVILAAVFVLGVSATAAAGHGRQVRYVGTHPIPKSEGGGICYIHAPHVHVFGADKLQYRDHDGEKFFVGDPVAYGYEGPKYAHKGHHPIRVDLVVDDDYRDVEYCYLDGPHYHAFAPPPGLDFKLAGGAYFYVGAPTRAYVQARPAMVQINAVYRPLVYERPVVVVTPPAGWIGLRVDIVTPAVIVPGPVFVIHGHGHGHGKFKHMKYKHWDD